MPHARAVNGLQNLQRMLTALAFKHFTVEVVLDVSDAFTRLDGS